MLRRRFFFFCWCKRIWFNRACESIALIHLKRVVQKMNHLGIADSFCSFTPHSRGCCSPAEPQTEPGAEQLYEPGWSSLYPGLEITFKGWKFLHRGYSGLRPKSCRYHTKSLERKDSLKVRSSFFPPAFKGLEIALLGAVARFLGNSGTLRPNVTE